MGVQVPPAASPGECRVRPHRILRVGPAHQDARATTPERSGALPPKGNDSAYAPVGREGEYRLASRTDRAIRPNEGVAETYDVVESDDARGQDKATVRPVGVERGDLLGDGGIADEQPVGSPNFPVCGKAASKEFT